MSTAAILLAHGSRDEGWGAPFERLIADLSADRTEAAVSLAYLQLAEPSLTHAVDRAIDAGATRIVVLPLFLATGKHVREDIDEELRKIGQQHPDVAFETRPTLGSDPRVWSLLASMVAAELAALGQRDAA